jgi:eukaryotic-like serine/threonine-protein kinase
VTPDRDAEIRLICQGALVRPPSERERYLSAACAGDASLRREVEALLAHDASADGFLATPAFEAEAQRIATAGEAARRAMVGTRLGQYDVLSLIGIGGMGEVYRARDTRLGRDVAVKILSHAFALDADRLARFSREAHLLASLNHPHIAAIHGLDEVDGIQFLVLELVDGETLATRLAHGPLPVDEAVGIAKQIAEALEAAHEKGIIHRDLKPANIALTRDGRVKVLDFGLAKVLDADLPSEASIATVGAATGAGVVLGTFAYMSPEQWRGKPIDKRADIWAFGCVLFELLAGRPAFARETATDIAAAIIEREPDWTALPPALRPRIAWLLRRCLDKDPKRRLHDVADARIELEEAIARPAEAAAASPATARGRERFAWAVAALSVIASIAALVVTRPHGADPSGKTERIYRSSIVLPDGLRLVGPAAGRFALSPDGRRLAFTAADRNGNASLWIRPLDGLSAQPLRGTEGASFPFWSPDSRFVAYLAQNKLKRIDTAGGEPLTICDATFPATGTWNRDDVILFTPKGGSPLYRVSASGGTPSPATMLDTGRGDSEHIYPFFLPDGRRFIYLVLGSASGDATQPRGVYVGSLDSPERGREVLPEGLNAKVAQGHLIFLRGSTLMVQQLDPDRVEVRGNAQAVSEATQMIGVGLTDVAGAFTVADTGAIVYQAGVKTVLSDLVWFDRRGTPSGRLGDRADYADVALSPDGARVAVSVLDPTRGSRDLWIYDAARNLRDRLTFDPGDEFAPSWSPDGRRLAFSSRQKDGFNLLVKLANGAGAEDTLLESGLGKFQSSWSSNARTLVYVAGGAALNRSDVWVLPLTGDRRPFAFLGSPLVETHAQLSPDGRWIAYSAGEEADRLEVYVAPFPGPGPRVRVSTAGGGWSRWRRDGHEIVYLTRDNTLVAVPVITDRDAFSVGAAQPLFAVRTRPFARLDAYPYDMSADGQKFLVNTFVEESVLPPITLLVNWSRGVGAR